MKIILNTVNIYSKKVENGYKKLENKISYRIFLSKKFMFLKNSEGTKTTFNKFLIRYVFQK